MTKAHATLMLLSDTPYNVVFPVVHAARSDSCTGHFWEGRSNSVMPYVCICD